MIVATKYYKAPVAAYRNAGILTVIRANHAMRAAVAGMRQTCARIIAEESIAGIESDVATLDEVFRLLGYDELVAAEEPYLPKHG